MSDFQLLGLGTALPEHSISQAEAAEFAGTVLAGAADSEKAKRLAKALYRRSGVERRHSVLLDSSTDSEPATQAFYLPSNDPADVGPGTAERMQRYELEAPKLAEAALRQAIENAGVDPSQLTHLVTVSCSGFAAPGFDLCLIRSLNLPPSIARTHVGFMGCHGALNGLRVAKAFADANPNAVVAVCAVELCTLHHQYGWDPQEVVANSLFADGAAAVIGSSGLQSEPNENQRPRLIDNLSSVIPNTEEMMTWRIGDRGFRMTLSPEVPDIILRDLPELLDNFLAKNGLARNEIQGWAIHPGGPRILKACQESLDLTNDQLTPSTDILARCGNMSSPTVLFILNELMQQTVAAPYVMLGFGPGLNVEAALLR
jgi:predicted naringenin-chalcone synthase